MTKRSKHLSTWKEKLEQFVLIFSLVALVAAIGVNLFVRTGPEPDVVYRMANQHIEWTYAGKAE